MGVGDQDGGHRFGVSHVVDPVAEVDPATVLRLAGIVDDDQVSGEDGDELDVGLQLALDIGHDQAMTIPHPIGEGGQDHRLGLARALGAKDSHPSGDVLPTEAELPTQPAPFRAPELASHCPAPPVGFGPAAECAGRAQMSAAQCFVLHLVSLQDLPRPFPRLFLESQIVDDEEQTQAQHESSSRDLFPAPKDSRPDKAFGDVFQAAPGERVGGSFYAAEPRDQASGQDAGGNAEQDGASRPPVEPQSQDAN